MHELLIIAILVALNGMLAGAELALVSARKSRLQRLAEEGSRAAQAAMALRAEPERFLATVQVGITLIGAF
ncbi:MAG TPA: CNNM domain-containing protein, partial [Planctomycetota bacterium]|nr:CNNM domain-containing protein [Planctomycetota bacterium]